MEEKIEALKTQTLSQETEERDLTENKDYKACEISIIKVQAELDELQKSMGVYDITTIHSKKKGFIVRREKLQLEKGSMIGSMGQIQGQIKKIESEKAKPEYKEAEKNYRKVYYDVEITKKIIDDLGQYRVVLDHALMTYHTDKMKTINKLILGFWRTIYRGNDIDYIKIQTEADSTASAADKKRSFNYRVVYSKNRQEIDMRGRCSAGQRVLACLIIRLALAETFSVNCGVLALDEPTTNLDKKNILSLCDALNQLVHERKAQQNFMLIVITHDEDFIQTLGGVQCYHQIIRNNEGKSEIRPVELAQP